MTDPKSDPIRAYYHALFAAWGRQHWWPARSRFEVIVGAYLTQNTSWSNVERALASLRQARRLSINGIRRTPRPKLEQLVRSAGYFRQKAQRLKTFVRFLDRRYGGSLTRMFAQPTAQLREELLALNGVGPETADSILLYAGNHPVFVVDAYTRRILERHRIISPRASYDEIRELFEEALAEVAPASGRLSRGGPESLSQREFGEDSGSAHSTPSREAAQECSPRREPWVQVVEDKAPKGRKKMARTATAPPGSSHPPSAMSEAARTARVQVFNEMHGLLVGVGKNFCLKSQVRC